jgi:hypothetical protein
MFRFRIASSILAVVATLSGCATARMPAPPGLESVEPWPVAGVNPRIWNRPIAFGPWRTAQVREGATFSWGVEAFGLGAGATRRPYQLVLTDADGRALEVACVTRAWEVWRGSLSVDLTTVAVPRLACAIGSGAGEPAWLLVGEVGTRLEGSLSRPGEESARWSLASAHHLEGSRLPSGDPVGYILSRNGRVEAAVETINRGRVWIAPGEEGTTRELLAAAAAALLLFEPGLSQR